MVLFIGGTFLVVVVVEVVRVLMDLLPAIDSNSVDERDNEADDDDDMVDIGSIVVQDGQPSARVAISLPVEIPEDTNGR